MPSPGKGAAATAAIPGEQQSGVPTLDRPGLSWANKTGDQSWVFIGRTDAEGETPILWPSDEKS